MKLKNKLSKRTYRSGFLLLVCLNLTILKYAACVIVVNFAVKTWRALGQSFLGLEDLIKTACNWFLVEYLDSI